MKLNKYLKNLKVKDENVYSYNTLIAKISKNKLKVLEKYEKYSMTTSKHINYVAKVFSLEKEIVQNFD